MRWLDGITNSTDMNLSKLQELGDEQEGLACCSVWGRKELDTTEQLKNKKTSPESPRCMSPLVGSRPCGSYFSSAIS